MTEHQHRCSTCSFSSPKIVRQDGGVPVLECHRYPPVLIANAGVVMVHTVQVEEVDWCGEYRGRMPLDEF